MKYLMLPLLALGTPAIAADARFQDTAVLDIAVAQFTGRVSGEDGGARSAIDQRLKLAKCQLPQLDWRTPTHDAVVIRCMAPVWRIFVPVARTTPISAPIAASVAPLSVRPASPEKAETIIKRGDAVRVEAVSGGFVVSRDGFAMSDASEGGRVQIKVEDKKPPIQAIAVEPGRATLPGWGK